MARSLRFWLSLSFSTFVAVTVALVVAALLWVLIPRLNAGVEAKNRSLGQAVAGQVEGFFQTAEDELQGLAKDLTGQPELLSGQWRLMADTVANSIPHVEAIYLLDANDQVLEIGLALGQRARRSDLIGTDFSGRSFVRQARHSRQDVWADTYLSQRGRIVAALALPLTLRDRSGVTFQGSLVGEFDLDQVSSVVRRIGRLGDVLPIIVDRHGQIVGHPDAQHSRRQENISHLALLRNLKGVTSRTGVFELDRIDYIGSTTPIADLGWTVLVGQPVEKAYATVRSTLLALAAASGLAVTLALLSAFWMSRRMSRQVADFGRHMQTIANGDYTAFIPHSGTDEIEVLAQSMRQMAEAVLQREARHSAINQSAYDAIITSDSAGYIVGWNRGAQNIFGYAESEALNQPLAILIPERFRAQYLAGMDRNGSGPQVRVIGKTVELSGLRKDGSEFPLEFSLAKWETAEGWFVTRIIRDNTERKKYDEDIQRLAFSDPLTDLPNRRLLMDRLEQALASALRRGHQNALLFVDIDDFKTLNDSLGHGKGDQLLQQIAKRVLTCVREGDTVARLGGDEFVVLLADLDENPQGAAAQAEVVGRKIRDALHQPYQLDNHGYHSTASIGITLFGGDRREHVEEPLQRAELAMYKAKAAGRGNLRFFETEMRDAINARAILEADLHQALSQAQFLLYYQAQVDGGAHLTGVEALVRWQHPERGLISPGEFIPVAEVSGLILPLGHWVLETACKQLAAWQSRPEMAHLTIAVNVSARQFRLPSFVEEVLAILEASGANPKRLKLELTESLLLDNMQDVIAKMTALKARGVVFSLDDFGTGYSSLAYLKRLPLDQLKIDQGFVRDILTDPNDAAIAKMVIALAESMGLAVIAEGVETQEQRKALAALGCTAYQGYLFSRPLPIQEFEKFAQRARVGSTAGIGQALQ